MGVITISKECATQSQQVAKLLAEKLGWEYVSKELLAEIAKELNISESDVEALRRDSDSRVLRFVDRFTCSIVQKVVDREYGCLDDKNYYETTKGLVEKLYEAGDVIILGWGGQCILAGKPGVLHVRLTKDLEGKIATLKDQLKMDRQSAMRHIEREEKDSKSYIKHYFNKDWNDADLYDLIINMGETSVEKAVDLIYENARHKFAL